MTHKQVDPLADLHTAIAMLNIRATYLFITEDHPDRIRLANLLTTAISVVEIVGNLNKTMQISEQWPHNIFEAIVLAASVLLRLVKGIPPGCIDQTAGTTAIFSAINILKSMSFVTDDVPSRVAGIVTKLWSSNEVFRNSKGEYDRALRVRNRLIVSVAFDCFWWYRKVVTGWPSSVNTEGEFSGLINEICILNYFSKQESYTHDTELHDGRISLGGDFFGFWGFDWTTGVGSTDAFADPQYIGIPEQNGGTH